MTGDDVNVTARLVATLIRLGVVVDVVVVADAINDALLRGRYGNSGAF